MTEKYNMTYTVNLKLENDKIKKQNKKMLGLLKDISGELKLSNDQNTLEIDGCHMNILAVWNEIDKLIEKSNPDY